MRKRQWFTFLLFSIIYLFMTIPVKASQQTYDTMHYFPYTQYTEYQYVGDGHYFDSLTIILEFAQEDERFQMVEISPTQTVARIFEINYEGLFEVGRDENYLDVEDLRYQDNILFTYPKLILPRELTLDKEYTIPSFGKSIKLVECLDSIMIDAVTYYDVLVVEERSTEDVTYIYYYARDFGLILVEVVEPHGEAVPVFVLSRASGYYQPQ